MPRVPNTPRVQAQAVKENKKRAIAGVKTVGKVTARVNANIGGKSAGETRPGLNKLAYKTAVATDKAKSAGISPKKIAKVLKSSSK
jgi:hypothetical protein